MATFLDGRITEAVATFGRVARLFVDSGELLRAVTPRSTRGHGLVFAGEPAEGLAETSAAVRLARELDTAEGQAYALWHRSEALSALGRLDEAEADAREALAVPGTPDTAAGPRPRTARSASRCRRSGELDEAAAAFAASAEAAGSRSRCSRRGRRRGGRWWRSPRGIDGGGGRSVAHALAVGPPLGHYEARLAEVELAAARGADEQRARRRCLGAGRGGWPPRCCGAAPRGLGGPVVTAPFPWHCRRPAAAGSAAGRC